MQGDQAGPRPTSERSSGPGDTDAELGLQVNRCDVSAELRHPRRKGPRDVPGGVRPLLGAPLRVRIDECALPGAGCRDAGTEAADVGRPLLAERRARRAELVEEER